MRNSAPCRTTCTSLPCRGVLWEQRHCPSAKTHASPQKSPGEETNCSIATGIGVHTNSCRISPVFLARRLHFHTLMPLQCHQLRSRCPRSGGDDEGILHPHSQQIFIKASTSVDRMHTWFRLHQQAPIRIT